MSRGKMPSRSEDASALSSPSHGTAAAPWSSPSVKLASCTALRYIVSTPYFGDVIRSTVCSNSCSEVHACMGAKSSLMSLRTAEIGSSPRFRLVPGSWQDTTGSPRALLLPTCTKISPSLLLNFSATSATTLKRPPPLVDCRQHRPWDNSTSRFACSSGLRSTDPCCTAILRSSISTSLLSKSEASVLGTFTSLGHCACGGTACTTRWW
mmetsp:Transcript_140296/g.349746  ORF Transcript_140296/g.349746 Transcript_140296/m.349746 type:complete len:209 (-) Transcript_140296:211-837(-)